MSGDRHILEFIKEETLPTSTLDLNLVDSSLWKALKQNLYHQQNSHSDHLKHILLDYWVKVRAQ